ncbi:MAG TPA: hypothetical protein VH394_12450 [Thermoanaerobaculia bacterium]|jgi:hypothetical protein|nr:hypothetical protein [Thermoanaerobaculia bacterium]
MGLNKSYADLSRDWRGLLDRCSVQMPELDLSESPLSWALLETEELREMRKGLDSARRRLTQRLKEVRGVGLDEARRLKGLLTWQFGTQDPGAMRSRDEKSLEGSERRRTMRETTQSGQLGEWQRLRSALQINQEELSHLEPHRTQFATLVGQAEDFFQSQAALAASKQEASQQLAKLVSDCQRMATVLRFSLKQFYGPSAEKLTEFGIQPFRGRKKLTPPTPPPAESTEPADPVPAVE